MNWYTIIATTCGASICGITSGLIAYAVGHILQHQTTTPYTSKPTVMIDTHGENDQ